MVVFEGATMLAKQSCTVRRMTRPIERISRRMLEDGVKPREVRTKLAAICGVSYQAVAQWFTTDTDITADNLLLIARALRTSVEWILTGKELANSTTGSVRDMRHIGADVPIVDFATLADALISEAPYPATMAADWIPCTMVHGQRTLAYRMPDSSMTTLDEHTIPEGFTVCVDPDQRAPKDGEAILARLTTGRYLTARYRSQAGSEWVELPNHPQHLQPTGPFEVVGRVIFSGRER